MEDSFLLGVAVSSIFVGFVLLAVAMRSMWVNVFYTPPKRRRRSNK